MRKAIRHLKGCDPVLAGLIERIGPYRIEYSPPNYQTLAKAIVLQQVSGKAAGRIFARLLAVAGDGELTPERVLALEPWRLRQAGLSRQKVHYLRELAGRIASGALDLRELEQLPDE
ncbi:MAG: DNA-3-methyladenine glycosylase family protein, partial [Bryobacteraceae bacterium]